MSKYIAVEVLKTMHSFVVLEVDDDVTPAEAAKRYKEKILDAADQLEDYDWTEDEEIEIGSARLMPEKEAHGFWPLDVTTSEDAP